MIQQPSRIVLILADFTVKGSLVYLLPPSLTYRSGQINSSVRFNIKEVLRVLGNISTTLLTYHLHSLFRFENIRMHTRFAYCEAPLPPEILRAYLPCLIPVLLSNMAYAEDDESLQRSLEKAMQHLKPRFHSSRFHGFDDADDDVCLTSL
ncbi:hypothetical protein L2E82_37509 [Cichorium intybus]|uniref:Uncharacterized protein n=1 Tax=Cichorium intybus TaxID=13427 RepID=A0ACB9AFQ1_CICIN|nr:hypothetical protein L2E82_37509 [Cichorium intybus]